MNRNDLIQQIYRESNVGATKKQIGAIINTMTRVMLEELLLDPEKAQIRLHGIGIFKLQKRKLLLKTKPEGRVYGDRWLLRYIPTKPIKDIINGKKDIHTWIIGHDPAYPEYKKVNYVDAAYMRSFIKKKGEFKRGITVVDKARKQRDEIAKRLPDLE